MHETILSTYLKGNPHLELLDFQRKAPENNLRDPRTNWGDNDNLGGLVNAILIGPIDRLEEIVGPFNSKNINDPPRTVGDKGHALLVMPLDTFKGSSAGIR